MKKLVCTLMVGVVTALLVPSAAWSSGEARQHDGGFFLRFSGGLGYSTTSIDDGSDEVKFKGPSGDGDLAIGVGIGENLAVHGTLFGWTVVDPTLEINGSEFETSDLSLSLVAFGGGVTYYVGESNLYVTGSAGIAKLTAEADGESGSSDTGFAVEAGVGKEWWVGDSWGVGAAGMFNFHSVTAEEDFGDEKFSGASFGVRFSATLN